MMIEKNDNVDDDFKDDAVEDDVHDHVTIGKENFGVIFANRNNVVSCVDIDIWFIEEVEMFYRKYGCSVGFEIIIKSINRHSYSNY